MKLFQRFEDLFESTHLYTAADNTRSFLMSFLADMPPQFAWRETLHAEQRRGFCILQREIYLKEKLKARLEVSKSGIRKLSTQEVLEVEDWGRELGELDVKYWVHKRVVGRLESEKPRGPWVRDWESKDRRVGDGQVGLEPVPVNGWRPELVRRRPAVIGQRQRELCKRRGGCCARGCGCCEKYLETDREVISGHCTIECGCCIRNRGFRRPDPGMVKRAARSALPWDANL